MASLALDPAYRGVSVREFFVMNFNGAKAELVDGMVLMKVLDSPRHAAITANLVATLGNRLRGTGCRSYGSDLAVRTGEASIRFPDVSIYCRDDIADGTSEEKLLGVPRVIFEVLSPWTTSNDQIIKLAEYRALEGVAGIVFVDPEIERIRLVEPGAARDGAWLASGSDLDLPMLGITLPHAEIFE